MTPTHRSAAILLAGFALIYTANAFASAGGRYECEQSSAAAAATPTEQRANAEQASRAAWESLREQVSDLPAKATREPKRVAVIAKPQAVRGEALICQRVALEGTRIKRRVCRSATQRRGRVRNEMITSQVFRWSNGTP
ncbi:MAG: hypothetical protein AAGA68_25390 [Pseudomonadota bacterium]